MIVVHNFSSISEEEIQSLSSSLNALSIPGNFEVEVWNSGRDVHTDFEIALIRANNPFFDPDESAGEVHHDRIKLFRLAFILSSHKPQKTLFIALHEIGHYVTGGGEEEADNWARSILPSYDLLCRKVPDS